ncbi:hypothetical protein KAI58_00100 [Candidatus Gracilibacteria bacterium]|nr:hypothetical protein [Candidatus Gracilibacteria bacterium]
MRFFKKHWKHSKKSRKSAFGGEVKSQEEIEVLNKKIKAHEEAEMEVFEKKFDKQLKDL